MSLCQDDSLGRFRIDQTNQGSMCPARAIGSLSFCSEFVAMANSSNALAADCSVPFWARAM